MFALLQSTASRRVLIALAGFASGDVTNAAAHREAESAMSRAAPPAFNAVLVVGGTERGAFGEPGDLQAAAAATLSSGAGMGGEISRPLSAL